MAIDVGVVGSPGWWMQRLWRRLEQDQKRFATLEDHYAGRPPLVWGSEKDLSKFRRFQQTSRTNFAALVVNAPCEPVGIRSVMTGAADDDNGDKEAWKLVIGNDLDIHFDDAVRNAFKFGRSYLMTSSPDETGLAVITAEDPRCMITEPDPVRSTVQRAAFKIFHDPAVGLDVAILWLDGQKCVAVNQRTTPLIAQRENGDLGAPAFVPVTFSPQSFTMRPEEQPEGAKDDYYSESFDGPVPVQLIENRDGVGEFELHIDLLNRLNHFSFILMVITTMQAFRQRVLEQSTDSDVEQLDELDESGQPIDYSDLIELGPDALALLPPGAKITELGQADLSGILAAVKADILKLSAVTRTPMSIFTPDAVSQTAEGAQLAREGMTFKVERFLRGAGRALSRAIATGFSYMGDEERSDPAQVSVNFLPVERYSLAEKGSAAAQAVTSLPLRTIMELVWQMDPQQIAEAESQKMQELMVAQVAASAAAPKPVAPIPPDGGGGPAGNAQPTDAAA